MIHSDERLDTQAKEQICQGISVLQTAVHNTAVAHGWCKPVGILTTKADPTNTAARLAEIRRETT